MSNETKTTKESANAVENAVDNAQIYETKSYTRTIVGADFDSQRNCVWLKLNESFLKGDEIVDSFGKNSRKLSESGAHPLFTLIVKAGKKPKMGVCLLLGATVKFDVVFAKVGETVDGFTMESDTFCVTNVKILANQPDQFFIDAAKSELSAVESL